MNPPWGDASHCRLDGVTRLRTCRTEKKNGPCAFRTRAVVYGDRRRSVLTAGSVARPLPTARLPLAGRHVQHLVDIGRDPVHDLCLLVSSEPAILDGVVQAGLAGVQQLLLQ